MAGASLDNPLTSPRPHNSSSNPSIYDFDPELGAAMDAEARRQQTYLERVVDVSLPDRALYPKRLRAVLIVFVSCFLFYSIARLLIAGVREHAQQ